MKLLSLDLETTGTEPRVHGVTEFGAVYTDLFGQWKKPFYRWLNPEGYTWSVYCLNLHKEWLNKVVPRVLNREWVVEDQPIICQNKFELIDHFNEWCKTILEVPEKHKFTPAGKNLGSFDLQFLKVMDFPNVFRHRVIDPSILYLNEDDTEVPDLTVCKARAIAEGYSAMDKEVKHSALDDAMDIVDLIKWRTIHPLKRN